MGWIGLLDQLNFYLSMVHADKNEKGEYLVAGEPVVVGLGGLEVVVREETVYFVDGKPKALAAGLRSTSYGMGVKVI
jgi:hypothetical protein